MKSAQQNIRIPLFPMGAEITVYAAEGFDFETGTGPLAVLSALDGSALANPYPVTVAGQYYHRCATGAYHVKISAAGWNNDQPAWMHHVLHVDPSEISANSAARHASGSDAETVTTIGALINGSGAATPDDADKFGFWDSVSGLLAHITFANFKAGVLSVIAADAKMKHGVVGFADDPTKMTFGWAGEWFNAYPVGETVYIRGAAFSISGNPALSFLGVAAGHYFIALETSEGNGNFGLYRYADDASYERVKPERITLARVYWNGAAGGVIEDLRYDALGDPFVADRLPVTSNIYPTQVASFTVLAVMAGKDVPMTFADGTITLPAWNSTGFGNGFQCKLCNDAATSKTYSGTVVAAGTKQPAYSDRVAAIRDGSWHISGLTS